MLGFLGVEGLGRWVLGFLGFRVLERDMGFWGSWGFEERRVFEREVFGPPWKWRKRDLEDLRRRGDGIWVIDGVMMRR